MKKILIVIFVFIVLIIPLWLIRFSIYPMTDSTAYKLDRWTGKVTFYMGITEISTINYEIKTSADLGFQPDQSEKRSNKTVEEILGPKPKK